MIGTLMLAGFLLAVVARVIVARRGPREAAPYAWIALALVLAALAWTQV